MTDPKVLEVAERLHGGPLDSSTCDNPACAGWCIEQAKQVIRATGQADRKAEDGGS